MPHTDDLEVSTRGRTLDKWPIQTGVDLGLGDHSALFSAPDALLDLLMFQTSFLLSCPFAPSQGRVVLQFGQGRPRFASVTVSKINQPLRWRQRGHSI